MSPTIRISCASLWVLAGMFVTGPAFAASDSGAVKVSGSPGAAAVFIDNKYAGPARRFTITEKYDVPPGEVEIAVRDPRYEDFSTKVTVQAGKTVHVHYNLKKLEPAKPPFGTFRLGGGEVASEWSIAAGDVGAVYLNDKYYGYVDELNNRVAGLLLPPGTYDLHIDSPLFGDIRQKITIEANKTTVFPLPKKD